MEITVECKMHNDKMWRIVGEEVQKALIGRNRMSEMLEVINETFFNQQKALNGELNSHTLYFQDRRSSRDQRSRKSLNRERNVGTNSDFY